MSEVATNSGDVLGPIPGLRGKGVGGLFGGLLGGMRRGPSALESLGVVGDWWKRRTSEPGGGGRRFKRMAMAGLVVAILGGSVGAYFVLRPVSQPDYMTARLDDVFNYTLLTDEFNKLPVEERLALMGKLVQRMKSMSAGDSMLLAAFASGIGGAAREQIERNASRLAIDTWDKYAIDYADVDEEERGEYLEKTFIEFSTMMEVAIDGKPMDKTDEQRIEDMNKQVEQDRAQMRKSEQQPSGEEMGRFFAFMNTTVAGQANAQQRTRGQQMLRDMTRHFRGQDISTGAPKKGPG